MACKSAPIASSRPSSRKGNSVAYNRFENVLEHALRWCVAFGYDQRYTGFVRQLRLVPLTVLSWSTVRYIRLGRMLGFNPGR